MLMIGKDTSGRDLDYNIVRVLDLGLRHFSDADLEGFFIVDCFHGRHCLRSVGARGFFRKEWKKIEKLDGSAFGVMA